MANCLNKSDKNVQRLINDFSEVKVSELVDKYFKGEVPTYEEFIANKNVKQEFNLIPKSKIKEHLGKSYGNSALSKNLFLRDLGRKNNELATKGSNRTYKAYNVRQLRPDVWEFGLRYFDKALNIEAKIERLKEKLILDNKIPEGLNKLESLVEETDIKPKDIINPDNLNKPKTDDKGQGKLFQKNESEINYSLKSIEILSSDKAKQVFEKGTKNKWPLDKMLSELQIPKEQKQLILNLGKTNREEIITDLLSNYSYTIEINTAKENANTFNKIHGFDVSNVDVSTLKMEETDWGGSYLIVDANGNYLSRVEYSKEEAEEILAGIGTRNTAVYSNLTVPGGTNYTENEIATPAITPSIQGHAQFATDKGIGWFRSDDKTVDELKGNWIKNESELPNEFIYSGERYFKESGEWQTKSKFIEDIETVIWRYNMSLGNERIQNKPQDKTRRILEVQSDLFQKGRDKDDLVQDDKMSSNITDSNKEEFENAKRLGIKEEDEEGNFSYTYKGINYFQDIFSDNYLKYNLPNSNTETNQFLQLLNKDNNWVTFFIKSIIQDSAKKGYEKVLFPTGKTVEKIEGFNRITEELENINNNIKKYENIINEKQGGNIGNDVAKLDELKKQKEHFLAAQKDTLSTINFYENTVTNILKKQGYNPVLITDEYSNTWNEIEIKPEFKNKIQLQKLDTNFTQTEANDILEYFGHVDNEIKEYSLKEVSDFIESNNIKGVDPQLNESNNVILKDLNNETIQYRDYNELINNQSKVLQKVHQILDTFKTRFNINYTFDFDIKNRAEYDLDTDTIIINPSLVKLDSPFHEIAHPLILIVKKHNPALYNALINEAKKNTEVYNKKALLYPELSEEKLFEEVLAEIIGLVSKDKYESKKSKSLVERFFNYLSNLLSKILGTTVNLDKLTSINKFAEMLANSNSKFAISEEFKPQTGERLAQASDEEIDALKQSIIDVGIKDEKVASVFKDIETDLKIKLDEVERRIKKMSNKDTELNVKDSDKYLVDRKRVLKETLVLMDSANSIASIAHYIDENHKHSLELMREFAQINSKFEKYATMTDEEKILLTTELTKYNELSASSNIIKALLKDPLLGIVFSSDKLKHLGLTKKMNESINLMNKMNEQSISKGKLLMRDIVMKELKDSNIDNSKVEAELRPRINKLVDKVKELMRLNASETNSKKAEKRLTQIEDYNKKIKILSEQLDFFNFNEDAVLEAISFSQKDLGALDAITMSAIFNPDIVVSNFTKFIMRKLSELRNALMGFESEVGNAYKKLSEKSGKFMSAKEEFADFIEIQKDFIYGYNENGESIITGEKEYKALISEIDFQKFNNAKSLMYLKAKTISDERARSRFVTSWLNENTESKPKEEIEALIKYKTELYNAGFITTEEFDEWNSKNRYYDVDNKKYVYRGDFAQPKKSLYASAKYKALLLPQNKHKYEFYKWYKKQYEIFQDMLPYEHRKGLRLPSIDKGISGRLLENGLKEGLSHFGSDLVKYKTKDQDYGLGTKQGVEKQELPVYFTQDMPANEQSSDLISSLLLFGKMAMEYQAKEEIHPQIKMMVSTMAEREYGATASSGGKIFSGLIKKLSDRDKQLEKDGSKKQHNSTAQFIDFVDNVIYGKRKHKTEYKGFAVDKLIDNITYMSSLSALGGLRPLKIIANNLQANAMNLTEAFSKQYLGVSNYTKGLKVYHRHQHEMVGDIINKKLNNKTFYTRLIEYFDAIQGEYTNDYGRAVSGSHAKKLSQDGFMFHGQKTSEHQAQIVQFFGYLNAHKIDSNGNVWSEQDYVANKLKSANLENISAEAKNKLEQEAKKEFESIKHNLLEHGFRLNDKNLIENNEIDFGNGKKVKVKFDENQKFQLESKINSLGGRLYGVYSQINSVQVQRTAMGRAIMQFRKFLPPGFKRRYKSFGYDAGLNDFTEGMYFTFLTNVGEAIKEKSFKILFNWSSMTPLQRANMLRTYAELSLIALTIITARIVSQLKGDDDEEKDRNRFENYTLNGADYLSNRLLSELKQFFWPPDFLRIMSTPAIASSYIERMFKLLAMFITTDNEGGYALLEKYKRDSGMWKKGDSKALAKFLQLFGLTGNEFYPKYATKNLKRFL